MNIGAFIRYLILISLFLFISFSRISAQISKGGLPKTFSFSMAPDERGLVTIQSPSLDELNKEDIKSPVPYRFAINIPVDLDIASSGSWAVAPDGTSVWRLTIKAAGALALTLYFNTFKLPEEGNLFIYNPARTKLLGAYTSMNNDAQGSFATELVPGDQLTLEYNIPSWDHSLPGLHLSEIAYAYRGIRGPDKGTNDFGQSGECEVNINCPEGDSWQQQKNGIARISVKQGFSTSWCSGSLINNVRNDQTPYFLTAYHCGEGTTSTDRNKWIFYFNYEASGCPDPIDEPDANTMVGAKLVASSDHGEELGSDFYLLMLKQEIPETWNVYFNGWSRSETPVAPGVGIHHPQGDIQKISTYTASLKPSSWKNQKQLTHWKTKWVETLNGHGVTEGGSSGSPIFDNGGHIVGTLTGGDTSCDSLNSYDFYGRFSYHWDKNGSDSLEVLKYWLDPDNTNTMTLNGIPLSVENEPLALTIKVIPNPFTDKVTVVIPKSTDNLTLKVRDLMGKEVFKRNYSLSGQDHITVNLEPLAPGIYFLTIDQEKTFRVVKLIKQR